MQFCIWISVILATIFLLHTQVEASTAMQIVPANPSKRIIIIIIIIIVVVFLLLLLLL